MRLAGSVPLGRTLRCECLQGDCGEVVFGQDAFASLTDAAAGGTPPQREVMAMLGNYRNAIGSRKKGSLTFTKGDGALLWQVELREGPRADDIRERAAGLRLLGRPMFDQARSRLTERAGVATVSEAFVRGILIGATDNDEGWPEIEVD